MRPLFVLAVATAFPLLAQQQSQPAAASLDGQVVNAKTGEPIRRAQITLHLMRDTGRNEMPTFVVTASGNDGRFQFQGIAPGPYILQAERTGFVLSVQPASGGRPTVHTYTLAPGSTTSDVKIEMLPQAVICGRVTDEEGEPVSNVSIQLLRASYQNGKRQFMPSSGANTNDLGEFRLFGLSKGRYYLSAVHRSSLSFGGETSRPRPDQVEMSYVPVYYPGGADIRSASPLDVVAGTELRGIDLRLVKARTVRLRGRVVSPDPEALRRGAGVSLMPRDGAGSMSRNFSNGPVNPETGQFELAGVSPGSYILLTVLSGRGRQQRWGARLPVEVGNTSIDNLALTLSPAFELSGSLQVEGDVPNGFGRNLTVMFRPQDGVTAGEDAARVQEDLTFSGSNLIPGVYTVALPGLPNDAYLKSVRLGNTEVRDTGLDLSQGAAGPLKITVSFAGAQVEGIVSNADQPFADATVALVPADLQHRELSFLYRTAKTDKDGHYLLKGIAPGDYKLFAWDKIEPGAYQSPEFLKPFESDGVSVSVQDNGRETKALKLLVGGQ